MSDLYIPNGAVKLDSPTYNFQRRVGIQGMLGTGKTFAAVSFPNPIVLSTDRGLVSHIGRSDVIELPFYNDAFVDSICPRVSPKFHDVRKNVQRLRPSNKKDAIVQWLETEALRLTSEQTLIIDNSSGIQAAYHLQYWVEPDIDKGGEIKPYAEFRQKIDYFTQLVMALKALKCSVVFIAHESEDRDAKGNINGQYRPDGKYP